MLPSSSLAASPYLGKLARLDLHYNGITDEGAAALLESSFLPRLVDLNVRDNPISEKMQEALRQRFSARSVR